MREDKLLGKQLYDALTLGSMRENKKNSFKFKVIVRNQLEVTKTAEAKVKSLLYTYKYTRIYTLYSLI